MNQLSIQRNPETKQLEVCFHFKDNLTVSFSASIDVADRIIKATCEGENLDADFFVQKFHELYNDLVVYSRYRAKMMLDINVDINSNYVFYKLICNGILTMNEIYWFDWYVKKHKMRDEQS